MGATTGSTPYPARRYFVDRPPRASGKSSGGCAARNLEKLRRVVCGWAQSVQAGRGHHAPSRRGSERGNEVMGKVRTGHSTSLDGFIAGPNDGPEAPMGEGGERLLGWYFGGDTEYRLPGTEMVFKVAPQTAELLRETRTTTGALVTGRRTLISLMGGAADTHWTYQSLLLPIRHHQSGCPRDHLLRSLGTASKAPCAGESGCRRQRRRRDRCESRAAVHQSGTPRRNTPRYGARRTRRRRRAIRPPRHRADRAGEHSGDRGRRSHASHIPRRIVIRFRS